MKCFSAPSGCRRAVWMGSCGVGLCKVIKTDKSHGAREALCRCEVLLVRPSRSLGRQGCLQAPLPAARLSPILRCSHSLSLLPACSGGQGQTCTPRYGQVPGSCPHCPLACFESRGASLPASPDPATGLGHVAPFLRQACLDRSERGNLGSLLPGSPRHRCH